jgi:hypothetical protein
MVPISDDVVFPIIRRCSLHSFNETLTFSPISTFDRLDALVKKLWWTIPQYDVGLDESSYFTQPFASDVSVKPLQMTYFYMFMVVSR